MPVAAAENLRVILQDIRTHYYQRKTLSKTSYEIIGRENAAGNVGYERSFYRLHFTPLISLSLNLSDDEARHEPPKLTFWMIPSLLVGCVRTKTKPVLGYKT